MAPAGLAAFGKYLCVSVGDPSQRATRLLSLAPLSNYSSVNHVISSHWCLPPTHRLIHWHQEQEVKSLCANDVLGRGSFSLSIWSPCRTTCFQCSGDACCIPFPSPWLFLADCVKWSSLRHRSLFCFLTIWGNEAVALHFKHNELDLDILHPWAQRRCKQRTQCSCTQGPRDEWIQITGPFYICFFLFNVSTTEEDFCLRLNIFATVGTRWNTEG